MVRAHSSPPSQSLETIVFQDFLAISGECGNAVLAMLNACCMVDPGLMQIMMCHPEYPAFDMVEKT